MERMVARTCREAGARVQENRFLRDLNLSGVRADDGRRIEVIANGLPLFNGAQLAIDATLVSPLRRDGTARPRAAAQDGVALEAARRSKETTYRELVEGRRCRLVVLALKVGGRWSQEAIDFVRHLAKSKARSAPAVLQAAVEQAYLRRWTGLLAFSAADALAASLLGEPLAATAAVDGSEPTLPWVLTESRCESGPDFSRVLAHL